jgi:hypothetical protein
MQKCPVKPKTSDLANGAGAKGQGEAVKYMSPARLAQLLGCSQRTAREYCKSGLIPEAFKTKGCHWRIRMPLSIKTRYELEKRSADWPFKGKARKLKDVFADDFAEWLMLAQVYQKDIRKRAPIPYLGEPDDLFQFSQQCFGKKEKAARRIQELIIERLHSRKPLHDLLLKGWVYQFWRKNKRCPTVDEIAGLMGISRDTFYRHGHTRQEIERAYLTASGESKRDLPDPDGFNPVQRANRKARKPGFERLDPDYDPSTRFI